MPFTNFWYTLNAQDRLLRWHCSKCWVQFTTNSLFVKLEQFSLSSFLLETKNSSCYWQVLILTLPDLKIVVYDVGSIHLLLFFLSPNKANDRKKKKGRKSFNIFCILYLAFFCFLFFSSSFFIFFSLFSANLSPVV